MPRRRSLYLLLIIVSLASVLFIRLSASRLSNDLTGLADFAAVDDWGEWVPEWMLPSADTLEEEENGNRGSLGDVAGAGDRKEAERIRTVRNRYNATFEQESVSFLFCSALSVFFSSTACPSPHHLQGVGNAATCVCTGPGLALTNACQQELVRRSIT